MIYAYIFSWLIGIPFIYFLLLYIYKKNNLYQKITINNNKEDTIVSHIITSLICVIYLSISGIRLYNRYSNILFEDKYIFKKNDDIINHIVIPMIIYQGWNTVITYLHKDLYSIAHIIHHVLVIFLGVVSFNGFYQYYGIIYFGLTEISNIFLSIIEYSNYEKYIVYNKKLNNINNILFVLSFYILRIIIFQYSNYKLYLSFLNEKNKVFSSEYIIQTSIILISNIFLSYLQFYWGYKIYNKIIETIKKSY
jgi:hypothetical protein